MRWCKMDQQTYYWLMFDAFMTDIHQKWIEWYFEILTKFVSLWCDSAIILYIWNARGEYGFEKSMCVFHIIYSQSYTIQTEADLI